MTYSNESIIPHIPVTPPPVTPPIEEIVIERKPEFPETRLSDEAKDDLFGLYVEDIMGGSTDMSDLLKVSNEEILGKKHLQSKYRQHTIHRQPPNFNGGMSSMR